MKFFLLLAVIIVFSPVKDGLAQSSLPTNTVTDDLQIVSEHRHAREIRGRKAPFRLLGNSFVAKYNPVSLTLSSLLFVYQRHISNTLSDRCIYHPSCSNFAAQAINEQGFVLGVILTTDRISRCNKIAAWDLPAHRFDERRERFTDELHRYQREP